MIPYRRMCWLAHLARCPGTAQTMAQAIWEGTQSPKPTCPLGRALHKFRRLGWRSMRGWWRWSLLHSGMVVHLVHTPKEYVEHLFREALRESQLTGTGLRDARRQAPATHPAVQICGHGAVTTGEGQGGALGSNPDGQGGREGVHPACPDYQPLSLFGAAGGRPGGRSEGAPSLHKTHGIMAPSEAHAAVQCRTVGGAATVASGKAATETETRPGTIGRHEER